MLNPITFPLPTLLREKYDLLSNRGLFDGDLLILPVWAEDYKAANNIKDKLVRGYASDYADLDDEPFEFEATNRDGRMTIDYILDELIATARANPCQYQPIVCHDYHTLDTDTDRTRGYTIRSGVLRYERLGGSFRRNGQNLSQGRRIIFTVLKNHGRN